MAQAARIFEKTIAPGVRYPVHSHVHANASLVISGTFEETFGEDRTCCPSLSVLFKPAGIPHTTRTSASSVRLFIMEIDSNQQARFGPGLFRPGSPMTAAGVTAARAWGVFLALRGESPAANDLEQALLRFWESARLESRLRSDVETRSAWLEALRGHLSHAPAAALLPPGGSLPRLAELANRFRVHPVHLARIIRKLYGVSLGGLVRRRRIDRAIDLLARSDAPIVEVAADLGYYDQSHFTREFRIETGLTPGRFRRSLFERIG